jgi:hypothetical protein
MIIGSSDLYVYYTSVPGDFRYNAPDWRLPIRKIKQLSKWEEYKAHGLHRQMGKEQPAGDEDEGSSLQSEVNRGKPGKIDRSADALQIEI